MRLVLSVLVNALILYGIVYFLGDAGVVAAGGWRLYFVGGIALGVLNAVVRPILSVLGFPFMIVTFGLFSLVINGVILALLEKIVGALNVSGVALSFGGAANFAIAIVIFTIFNTLHSVFFKK